MFPTPTFDEVVLGMPGDAHELHRLYGRYGAALRQSGAPAGVVAWHVGDAPQAPLEPLPAVPPRGRFFNPVIRGEVVARPPASIDLGLLRTRMQQALAGQRPTSITYIELMGDPT